LSRKRSIGTFAVLPAWQQEERAQPARGARSTTAVEGEGRIGGDERCTFFDTFVTLCGGHFQLGEVDGRERLLPVDGKGQPLTADGVALSDGDTMEELRRHPVYSFLFQQRSGLYSAAVPETGLEHGGAVNLQTLSTAELYLEAVKGTTPRAAAPRR
jgi:hypothetical protein